MTRLGDVSDMLVGFAFKSAGFLDADADGVRILRGDNVQQGYIRWGDKTKKWPTARCDGLERYQLAEDDVILAMDRPIVGDGLKMAWIRHEDLPALLVQRVCRLRGKQGVSLTNFIRYVLAAPDFSAHIHRITTGANIPHISGKDIAAYEFELPDLDDQARIVECLSAYDDLIATNQRRIALLEDAARRLYREWFVHLRFPGHESVPVKDGVPEGWCKKPMTSVADFVNGFAFKPEHLGEAGLPVVKIPELRSGITSKTPYNPGNIVPQRNHINTGDVLFSWSATLLVNEWGEGPALLNQHLFKVIPHNELHKRLVRFAVEAAIPELTGHAVGATMQHIRRSALDNHLMLVPDDTAAAAFAAQADPMMDAVLNLTAQNRELTKARDLLLPKLMSGQLDVSGIALPAEVAA
ncbi:MAG: restriction endonuclease subunit S [Thiomonas sp.]